MKLLKTGKAPGRMVGAGYRVHPEELDAYLRGTWKPAIQGAGDAT